MELASPHLARLAAQGRPAGSPAASEAREYCAGTLRAAGYSISERSFEYSGLPGSWAAPIAGAAASLCAIALFVGRHVRPASVVALLAVPLVYLALQWIGTSGVLRLPVMRRRGVNLQAARGGAEPKVWLVAHLDSKWQPVSMIARVAGIVVASVAGFGLLVLNFLPGSSEILASALLLVAWVGTVPIMLSVVREGSDGAVDNASGVAAVLQAAESLPPDANVGILITDAEELALAGSRAWALGRAPAIALNCDSVDDDGRYTIMHGSVQFAAVTSAFRTAAAGAGVDLRIMRLLPGVLTDSVALADAGWQTVTLSRGNARTLRRIHTSRDSLSAMRGTGIATAARMLAATALEFV
ncbi:MAG: M28 family peptidase [Gemmatimonadaceae bacterium]